LFHAACREGFADGIFLIDLATSGSQSLQLGEGRGLNIQSFEDRGPNGGKVIPRSFIDSNGGVGRVSIAHAIYFYLFVLINLTRFFGYKHEVIDRIKIYY
jgi:hypothetical protein